MKPCGVSLDFLVCAGRIFCAVCKVRTGVCLSVTRQYLYCGVPQSDSPNLISVFGRSLLAAGDYMVEEV